MRYLLENLTLPEIRMMVDLVTELFLKVNEDAILCNQCDNRSHLVAYLLVPHVRVSYSTLLLVLKAGKMGTLMTVRRGRGEGRG